MRVFIKAKLNFDVHSCTVYFIKTKGNSILKVKVTYINIKLLQVQELKTRTRKQYKLINKWYICNSILKLN